VDIWWKEFGPMLPVAVVCSLSCCHDASLDVSIDIMESMHPTVVVGRMQEIHDACCGKGKQV